MLTTPGRGAPSYGGEPSLSTRPAGLNTRFGPAATPPRYPEPSRYPDAETTPSPHPPHPSVPLRPAATSETRWTGLDVSPYEAASPDCAAGPGRPAHPLYKFFITLRKRTKQQPHPKLQCRRCQTEVNNAQTSRNMISHVIKCTGVTDEEKAPWRIVDAARRERQRQKLRTPTKKRIARSPTKVLFGTPGGSSSVADTSRKKNQRMVPNHTREENFMRVARGFYATGIPFRVVEDPIFRAMFDYELPSRRQLAERLLDCVYEEEQTRVKKELAGSTHLAVVSDGWSNPNHDQIINIMLAKPDMRPIFWKSFQTHDSSHTSEYIARHIGDAIGEIEDEIGKGAVTAVVTDNAANMKGAWKLLEHERQGVLCSGCAAHGMNLLMKDMCSLEELSTPVQESATLSRFVRSHDAMWSRFRCLQSSVRRTGPKRRRLSLPVPTRWYTNEKCIRNVVENKDVLAAVFADADLLAKYERSPAKLTEAKGLVQNEAFWRKGTVALKLFEPINKALARFEENGCCISQVYHEFETLLAHKAYTKNIQGCDPSLQNKILTQIETRRDFVCRTPMIIANFLDQTKSFYGALMADIISTITQATATARQLGFVEDDAAATEFHRQLVDFGMAKRGWTEEERKMHAQFHPIAWWAFTNKFPAVKPFATQILSIPTSSASSERSWSIHSFVHSKVRNRLSPERVSKLVYIYSNMVRKDAVDQVLYELFPDASDSNDDSEPEIADQSLQVVI